VRTKSGEVPLVTVEATSEGPHATTTPVRSADEAAEVASAKAAEGNVFAIDVDKPVRALADLQPQQWGLTQVQAPAAWAAAPSGDGTTGSGVTVGVIDTGVMATHPDLSGQVVSGQFFLHSADGRTSFQGSGGTTDDNGHGTHVAGIIAAKRDGQGTTGVAPDAKILPVKVLCGDGSGFSTDVANGITWAVNNGAKVINLSLGGGASSSLVTALQYAAQNDVVVVTAGGNCGQGGPGCSGVNGPTYPAAYSQATDGVEAIAVAATTNTSGHPAYSTVASYIDISAPGGAACGCGSSGDVLSTWNNGAWASIAGTSMATPHVSGVAALIRSRFGVSCTAPKVRSELLSTATDRGPTGTDATFGAGEVNALAAAAACP
jgi:subtilisin family serine protease